MTSPLYERMSPFLWKITCANETNTTTESRHSSVFEGISFFPRCYMARTRLVAFPPSALLHSSSHEMSARLVLAGGVLDIPDLKADREAPLI